MRICFSAWLKQNEAFTILYLFCLGQGDGTKDCQPMNIKNGIHWATSKQTINKSEIRFCFSSKSKRDKEMNSPSFALEKQNSMILAYYINCSSFLFIVKQYSLVFLGRKVMTNLDSMLKSRYITLPTKVRLVKGTVFPLVMYGCENWIIKKAEC